MSSSFNVCKQFGWAGAVTDKVESVMKMFGVDIERLENNGISYDCQLELESGDICYVTGASGAGKSVLLNEFYEAVSEEERIDLNQIELPSDRSVIDCIDGDCLESLRLLSKAGLNDVFSVLNQPGYLSEGQKYRFRLAKALSSGRKMIFADEFCSNLDRVTAAVIAYNIRKFAKRYGVSFILASSHDDIMADLLPDVIVIRRLNGSSEVIYRDVRRQNKDVK